MELSGKIFPNAQKPKKHVVNTPGLRGLKTQKKSTNSYNWMKTVTEYMRHSSKVVLKGNVLTLLTSDKII